MKVGIGVGATPPIRQTRAMVRMARMFRLDSVWLPDHFVGWFAPSVWDERLSWMAKGSGSPDAYFDIQVLAGHLASRLGGLQLGIGVTEPIRRHPVVIAQAFLTLAHLTRKPPILGIGPGERENTEPFGLDFSRPVARLAEALEVLRRCLDEEGPLRFEGEFFRLDGGHLDLRAPEGLRPEVWIAAHGPRMLELTGRFGDGWYPTIPMTPDAYRSSLDRIRDAAVRAGRDPGRIIPGMQAFVVLGPTDEAAHRILGSRAIRYLALLAPDWAWKAAGATHPFGEGFRGMVDFVPSAYTYAELEEAIAAVPVELVEEQMYWGSPTRVASLLRALGGVGLRHVVIAPASGLVSRRAALFALRSLPGLARRVRGSGVNDAG